MNSFKGIELPYDEYKKIISEINSYYALVKGKSFAAHLSVGMDGNYYIYYFVNRGFDDYTIVKRIKF